MIEKDELGYGPEPRFPWPLMMAWAIFGIWAVYYIATKLVPAYEGLGS